MDLLGTPSVRGVKRRWQKRHFDNAARAVLRTAPLKVRGDSPLFVSMTCHRDLICYLLSIKSLYVGFGHGRVAVINDGSLTSDDIAILNRHIPGIELFELQSIDTGSCPRGGTWERLAKIVELSRERYVIQVDADTLVTGPIPEVVDSWKANRSFLLGTGSGRAISSCQNTALMVRGWIKSHDWTNLSIGTEAEASLDRLAAGPFHYVHASSGFAGFARGDFSMAALERFSNSMADLLGDRRWSEYGSEQIASNYVLANAPNATVLPFPRYACFEPHLKRGDHAFLHFIGTYRYEGGVYRKLACEFIARYERSVGNIDPLELAAESASVT